MSEDSYPQIKEPKEGHTSHLLAFLSVLLVLGFGFWAAVGSLVGSTEQAAPTSQPLPTAQPAQIAPPLPTVVSAPSAPTAAPEATPGATAAPGSSRVHVVGQGDTLYRISQQYDTTVDELMAANDITDRSHILHIGDRLTIP